MDGPRQMSVQRRCNPRKVREKLREKRPAHVVHRPGMKMVLGWSERQL
jgi:hypothetical protein